MIDYGFEDRLLDRIVARQLIARRLDPRQRRFLCRTVRYGDTLREIGQREGLSPERVRQVEIKAWERLAGSGAEPRETFDRAAFLRHMQGLAAQREAHARWLAEREQARIDREQAGLAAALARAAEPPPLPPRPVERRPLWYRRPEPYVESWFDQACMPTAKDMIQIGRYAADYFYAVRRPSQAGLKQQGAMVAHAVCARTADAIAEALQRFARGIPPTARLSACMLPLAKDMLGVTKVSELFAMRIVSIEGGRKVSIEMTYDEA